ncbi:tRNA(Met) cytidine acetyltransferase TmcA [Candidatus Halobonum tyrrellensis]|uniref:tRNA(Met) cytidine acetyltransferase TmcA n=1 Tax=Candidatus Halobonum tyrrellensis G22 TaxID=1324957 RepID=V4J0V3_9EURY|nr:tRNA(Met) cytidine acetyltransferase TmcA [Candidatus Halobonum tyrrellensis]ESP89097.1 bifunctional p-loop ATPase/acetyltransferase [Candidatus Halobonum tyrrellensis G22]
MDADGGGPGGTDPTDPANSTTPATLADLAAALRTEAERTNGRRLLTIHGDRDACLDAAYTALDAAGVDDDGVTLLTTREGFRYDRLRPKHADQLLGTTRDAVVCDAFAEFSPNAVGQSVGAVDGGGLYVLLAPPLDGWPDRRDDFDESLAVPPFGVDDVTGRFRTRVVDTLRSHPGVAVYDAARESVERDGLTGAGAPPPEPGPRVPDDPAFPAAAYEACLTRDQSRALRELERLRSPGEAVVVEADRGRGKSSAAGLAAGALAAAGRDVLVTAPSFDGAAALFERARALLADLGALAGGGADPDDESDSDADPARDADPNRTDRTDRTLTATGGGRVRFERPADAAPAAADADAVVVDEAAALPVHVLGSFLDAPAAAFVTTVHGYEGAGRGFSVRFRDRLADADAGVTEVRLDDPIRYARDDPVESWAFRALLLDARPPVAAAVDEATPGTVDYRALGADDLAADEHLLREAFGLLVLAHYRTEPNDLARLLDAPNLSVRALSHRGRVVSVALLAREGGLDADTRAGMYRGERVRGNMVPDVLTSQLRDPEAGEPVGYRVMRIATHHAVRSRGLGSRLLSAVADEFGADADYLSTGFGATPELLGFWVDNGFRTVHLSTTRNGASGEHSAVMLRPTGDAGRALADRTAARFRDRVGAVLSDALHDADPDVVRATLRACEADPTPLVDCSDYEWRVVVGAAYGTGLYDAAPRPFRRLALAYLLGTESEPTADLDPREERLLVEKVLQGRPWEAVAADLGYHSPGECMRALGAAYRPLVDAYGGSVAREERARLDD